MHEFLVLKVICRNWGEYRMLTLLPLLQIFLFSAPLQLTDCHFSACEGTSECVPPLLEYFLCP